MNNVTLSRISQILGYVLLAVSVVLGVIFFMHTGDIDPDAAKSEQILQVGPILNYFLLWATILTGLAAFFTFIFPIGKMIINPKRAIKSFIMIVVFAIMIFLAWSFSSDELLTIPGYDGHDNVPERLKLAGTIIYTMYILLAGVLLTIIYSEVSKVFK